MNKEIVSEKKWLKYSLKITNIICAIAVFGIIGLNIINPFVLDTFKLKSFYFEKVDNQLYHAYFKPVGAYSGGYGNFWITKSPKLFPIIEREVYWNRTVHHDFRKDTFDGVPIDNREVVREYIRDKVIGKENK